MYVYTIIRSIFYFNFFCLHIEEKVFVTTSQKNHDLLLCTEICSVISLDWQTVVGGEIVLVVDIIIFKAITALADAESFRYVQLVIFSVVCNGHFRHNFFYCSN